MPDKGEIESTNPSEFRECECAVIGTALIAMPPIMEDKEGNIRIVPLTFRKLELKTSVRNYNEARFHLLAVAERIRNYAAYVLRARLPMDFDMVGKRRDNGQWFPFPAVFDGTTHLPITDGGVKDIMVFRTRFGHHSGVRPPDEALKSPENLVKWTNELNDKLSCTQWLLNRIESGTPLDVAVSSLGESIWAEEAKDRFSDRWRAIEAITKIDSPNCLITAQLIHETIKRRTDNPISSGQFDRLRVLRNLSIHSKPQEKIAIDIHEAAEKMCTIAYEVIESALRDAGLSAATLAE